MKKCALTVIVVLLLFSCLVLPCSASDVGNYSSPTETVYLKNYEVLSHYFEEDKLSMLTLHPNGEKEFFDSASFISVNGQRFESWEFENVVLPKERVIKIHKNSEGKVDTLSFDENLPLTYLAVTYDSVNNCFSNSQIPNDLPVFYTPEDTLAAPYLASGYTYDLTVDANAVVIARMSADSFAATIVNAQASVWEDFDFSKHIVMRVEFDDIVSGDITYKLYDDTNTLIAEKTSYGLTAVRNDSVDFENITDLNKNYYVEASSEECGIRREQVNKNYIPIETVYLEKYEAWSDFTGDKISMLTYHSNGEKEFLDAASFITVNGQRFESSEFNNVVLPEERVIQIRKNSEGKVDALSFDGNLPLTYLSVTYDSVNDCFSNSQIPNDLPVFYTLNEDALVAPYLASGYTYDLKVDANAVVITRMLPIGNNHKYHFSYIGYDQGIVNIKLWGCNRETKEELLIFIACYDDENRLQEVKHLNVPCGNFENNINIDLSGLPNVYNIKAFLWNSTESLQSRSECISLH